MTQNGPMRGSPGVLVGITKKETVCVEVAKPVGFGPGVAGDAFITPRETGPLPQDGGNREAELRVGEKSLLDGIV